MHCKQRQPNADRGVAALHGLKPKPTKPAHAGLLRDGGPICNSQGSRFNAPAAAAAAAAAVRTARPHRRRVPSSARQRPSFHQRAPSAGAGGCCCCCGSRVLRHAHGVAPPEQPTAVAGHGGGGSLPALHALPPHPGLEGGLPPAGPVHCCLLLAWRPQLPPQAWERHAASPPCLPRCR